MSQDAPLTILFTDVEGSTDLRTRRGDAAAHRILQSHEEIVRSCVAAHEGREVKALGDGFMVAFMSVRKALACARAIQRGLDERNRRAPGDAVHIRIGINTGEVVIEGDDLYGQAVNAAARIASRARGGEILVSDIVRQLAGSDPEFSFRDRGRFRLKGFPDRWHLYGLVSDGRTSDAATAPAGRTSFIGREAERAELRRLLDRAAAGEGGLVLIGGEPGVGKSRLTEEIAAEAAPRFAVLTGHCYESGRDLPYMPWVELIEAGMVDTDPIELRRSLGDEAAEFARLVPELRRLLPDIPPPLDLPPEQQRRYTFNSIREYVIRASRSRPRLYVLEDLHWADEPTLLLLEHLAERLASIACLVVGTHRDSPSDVTPQLADTLGRLVRQRQAHRLSLPRHSANEVAALLHALGDQAPPEKVCKAIYHETEGNAFFVEEVFRHLAESGRLLDEQGRFRTDVPIDELDVPANIRLVLGRRLDRLGEATRRSLSIAAVAGRHLGFELWEAIAGIEADALIDALDEAERAGLIVTERTGEREEYWFAHELIRQTLLTELPAERRRRHHLRVAEALERVFSDDLPQQAATIAAHLVEAGSAADPAKLFRYLVLAGSRALVSAAFEDALRHLSRAEALAGHATPADQAEMLLHLGMAERGVGRPEQAVIAWRRAIEIYEAESDTAAIGRLCTAAAWSLVGGGRFLDAHELAELGLAALGDEASADRGPLLAVSGGCVAGSGQYEMGSQRIAEALALADDLDDAFLAGFALAWKALVHQLYMESPQTVDSALQSAEVMRAGRELWLLSFVLGFVAMFGPGAGRFADARRAAAEGGALAERLGNHASLMQCGRGMAMVDWCETGDLDALEAFAHRDKRLCEDTDMPWVSWSWSWFGTAAFLRGDWESALRHLAKAEALSPSSVINGTEWALHFEYRAHAGPHNEAMAMLEARKDQLPRLGEPNGWGSWAILFSVLEGLVVLDEQDTAAELYRLVRWCMERTGNVILVQPDCRLLERVAGMAAAAGRNWDVAETHFTTALEQAATLPHRPEQAHARRFYAAMLLKRDRPGDRDAAARLIFEAQDLYRRMGMPRHCELAAGLLNAS
jgi:class 3 adenylate cyclase/tetratricopeptide (TPR) repeat protein